MAGTFTQNGINTGPESFHHFIGHEGLNGAGKTAAVDTVSALAFQIMLAQSQSNTHILMFLVTGGDDVLQVHPAGEAGFLDQLQEGIEVTVFQSIDLTGDPAVFLILMDTAQDGSVAELFPDGGHGSVKILLLHLGHNFLAQEGGNLLHFAGNGSILVGQISMACPGVNDAQGMTTGSKIKINGTDGGMILVGKVNGNQAAHSGGSLIHQAAGFAEEHVLGVLADHGNLRLGNLAVKEQVVDDGTDQHFKSSGGAEAGAGQNGGLHIGIKTAHGTTQFCKPGSNATDQSGGRVDFVSLGGQFLQVHFADGITLGQNTDGVGAVDTDSSHGIQIHRSGQNTATLMVGVVTADFGTARGREEPLRFGAKGSPEALGQGSFHSSFNFQCRCRHNMYTSQ